MNYVVIATGSLGDVLPSLAIAGSLRQRSHDVTIIAGPLYKHLAEANGVPFVPLSDATTYGLSQRDKLLMNGRYHGLFFKRYAVPWNVAIYRYLQAHRSSKLAVVSVDRVNLWADLLAHVELGFGLVRINIDLQ